MTAAAVVNFLTANTMAGKSSWQALTQIAISLLGKQIAVMISPVSQTVYQLSMRKTT